MEVKAQAKYVRISTNKVKRLLNLIRRKMTTEAITMLSFMPHHSARVTEEVIKSAVANATHNYKMDPNKLYISKIFADRATPYVRYRAQARGRGSQILHRQSHVTVYVSPIKEVVKKTVKVAAKKRTTEALKNT